MLHERIKVGDLVIKKGKFEASVYFVEYINEEEILLVNGYGDLIFYNDKKDEEIYVYSFYNFDKKWRLLAKAENLEKDGTLNE